ncbi:hypothetical protein EJ05DRAFT_508779 [Pseudovirgaria hyperparasitica]|uniref:Uncharacterized protein n=1 Tax=Pseudovirgaria hyperparasitica TaxID=470096 RepID=A0A6A6WBJ5_9PEZI|nr:uncharacterized protein EJ05DRAFT_508779 [Pseudovirgaria hyperparasitica]KAF2760218.1 hypothetical protein EJ05DRAFT_508779 [Pseudovirgaria hyperparasitica]
MSFIARTLRIPMRLSVQRPTRAQLTLVRPFQSSTAVLASKKDDLMDKDSMQTDSSEYSKTGSDSGAADESAAFDPSTTRPETEEAQAEKEHGKDSSLNVSPANHEASQPGDPSDNGAEGSKRESSGQESSRGKTSGGRNRAKND